MRDDEQLRQDAALLRSFFAAMPGYSLLLSTPRFALQIRRQMLSRCC